MKSTTIPQTHLAAAVLALAVVIGLKVAPLLALGIFVLYVCREAVRAIVMPRLGEQPEIPPVQMVVAWILVVAPRSRWWRWRSSP